MWSKGQNKFNESSAGGFFNNEPNNLGSPAQSKKGGQRRHQSVIPLFIRQIRDSKEDELKLYGMQVQIIRIVGILREYEVQSTKATYTIEDHTGRISAIWWLESDSDNTPNLPVVKEGCYVRVYGSLRVQDGQKMMMVLKMFPVDNINEVTSHMIECVHVRFEAEALSKGQGLTRINANNPGADLVNSMSFMAGDGESARQMGLTPIQEKVYNILLPVSHTTMGLSRQAVLKNFPENQHREVNNALEFLITEGHAYSTVDNDHFKVTDSM